MDVEEIIRRLEAVKNVDAIQIVYNALVWLDENEPKWGLSRPIDRAKFIANLLKKRS